MGRKVKIASFGLNEDFLRGKNQEEIIPVVMDKLESVRGYGPDLVCLPEAFLKIGGDVFNENWEEITGRMLKELCAWARKMKCYVVAPVYEKVKEHPSMRYNCTVLIDRAGEIAGKYNKVHTVDTESSVSRVLPASEIPVFDTDFGRIGFQTCFDIGWRDGWRELEEKGAKLVIWTAAYDGGNLLNAYAAIHMYYVVSSVRTDHAQIIDLTGRTIAEGARWNGLAMATIDLETELFHIDNQFPKIDEIRRELGEKIVIRAYSEENVFTIESNDPAWPMQRIKERFGLMTYREYHEEATRIQKEWREKYPI